MRLTTEVLNMEIERDRRMLRELPFRLRDLSGMVRGCWVVAAERQRGKSCVLAQLLYQRTEQRTNRRLYGVVPLVLCLRNESYYGMTGYELWEALSPLLPDDKALVCLDDLDLLDGWLFLLERLTARGAEVLATMSPRAAERLAEHPALKEAFGIRSFDDLSMDDFMRISKLNCCDALNRLRRWGRYPGVLSTPDRCEERLQQLFRTLLYEELLPAYKIRNEAAIRHLLHLLAEHLGKELSYNGLCRMLQQAGVKVGVTTVAEYVAILKKTRLVRSVTSLSERTSRLPKQRYWFCDNGLLSLFVPATRLHEQLLRNSMANSVLWEYCHSAVYCASLRNASIDFYIPEQVCSIVLCPNDEAIPDAVRDLRRFDRKYPTVHKYIYTVDKIGTALPSGIHNCYLFEWRVRS